MAKTCPDCSEEMYETDMSNEMANWVCPNCAPGFLMDTLQNQGLVDTEG